VESQGQLEAGGIGIESTVITNKKRDLDMVEFENVIDSGVNFEGKLRLVGDSMVSGTVNGDVVCIGKGAILYLGPQSSIRGQVKADVVVAAGVVDGSIQASTALYKVDGCALGEVICLGEQEQGSSHEVFMKSHLMSRKPEIDEASVIQYAIHQHCNGLHAGKAVIFEDGVERPKAGFGFFNKLKINPFKS